MNPCPCGYYSHPEKTCTCRDDQITRYFSRISGPLMDRIDLHIEVGPVKFHELQDRRRGDASQVIRARVEAARDVQTQRFSGHTGTEIAGVRQPTYCNAHMTPAELRAFCQLDTDGYRLMEHAMKRLGLTARAYDRILKVSRTIADLDASGAIRSFHVAEAIQYRALDRSHWAPAYAC
ncbi:ATP-binding protein [bacterium]|nr:ATP-binding protein [candidate division CSSED10-310 bacterium]